MKSTTKKIIALVLAFAMLTFAACSDETATSSSTPEPEPPLRVESAPTTSLPSSSKALSSPPKATPPSSTEENTMPDSTFEEPNNPPEPVQTVPAPQESSSGKKVVNPTQKMFDYLEENLSPDDYACTDIGWSDSGAMLATIWYINRENVAAIVEDYISSADDPIEVIYMEARYSLSELSPVLADVKALFSKTGGTWINIIEDVVCISLFSPSQTKREDILAWWNGYTYNDYVVIEIAPDSPFSDPVRLT